MTAPVALDTDQAHIRLPQLTVVDVRTPGEYASGHLPGALNIPLDLLRRALPTLKESSDQGELLLVCASGARSESACSVLAENGVPAMTLTGGTQGWQDRGHALQHAATEARTTWPMERQVRFTAGVIVLAGLGLGRLHPAWRLLSAGVAGGLVFSAVSNTCGMAHLLAKLPHNRPRPADLDATLTALARRPQERAESTGSAEPAGYATDAGA
ncbi:rhodanese-like domain-containing protein [Streptomyces sp. SID12501]|uniref:Rhodanese-like domain-containing protein n=1 Tax=Streptomyces sp. SID12501 TaxID=2706042 RepID=A0A6B3BLJ0_9ACTN|nr:rhodanese-like domain-containing protein [Streptomyces sp. SID12501]NEC84396.1 rhodanese-like domain-containing protein [Streptomyces sp. SID12501]